MSGILKWVEPHDGGGYVINKDTGLCNRIYHWELAYEISRLHDFKFKTNDTILFGRESSGVPENVHKIVNKRLIIPMVKSLFMITKFVMHVIQSLVEV